MEPNKIVEIVGGGFTNRGAELMVDACCQELASAPYLSPSIHWSCGKYEDRAVRGLKSVVELQKLGVFGSQISSVIPQKYRERLGIVGLSEVNAVLDIAGFAYSDQWGAGPASVMARRTKKRKKKGERYFVLPQAFGPFNNQAVKDSVKDYLDAAELIFVRDKISLEHVTGLMGSGDSRIKLSPDFTCLLKPRERARLFPDDYACVVPNCRMIDPKHGAAGDAYIGLLSRGIECLSSLGLRVILVNHEGAGDLALARKLHEKFPNKTELLRGGSGLKLKAIFSNSVMMIASRFHAIVSGMTQEIPVIGTSWSHKYKELYDDFGVPELLLDLGDDDAIAHTVSKLAEEDYRNKVKVSLRAGCESYCSKSTEMWEDVLTGLEV